MKILSLADLTPLTFNSSLLSFLSSIRIVKPASCKKFFFPDPGDPFGKASGRSLLTMELSHLVRLPEFSQGEFDVSLVPVNKTAIRSLEEWVDRVRVMQH